MNHVTLLIGSLLIASATSGVAEEPYWRTRPGGLAAVHFEFPNQPARGFYNFDFFITVTRDPGNSLAAYPIPAEVKGSDDYIGYYWANQFRFMDGDGGYMGLQTVGNIGSERKRIAIFSIWKAVNGRPGSASGKADPFGHEGTGWSCKVEYPWKQDVKYCLRIWGMQDQWWRGAIIDTSTNTETVIGDIQVPTGWKGLVKDPTSFTEYYSTTVNQAIGDQDDGMANPRVCQYMPKAEVMIDPPMANARTVVAAAMTPRNYGKCASVSSFANQLGNRTHPDGRKIQPAEAIMNRTGSIDRSPEAPRSMARPKPGTKSR